jgi:ribosomal protein L37E
MSGYTIAPDASWIRCHRCGRTSYNRNDVAQRYCGFCHRFHDDEDIKKGPAKPTQMRGGVQPLPRDAAPTERRADLLPHPDQTPKGRVTK